MAFTTSQRVKDLMRDQGTAYHSAPTENAITNAVNGANAFIEKLGIDSAETDAGILIAADRLAVSYLMEGEIMRQMLRGESQAVGSYRLAIDQLRAAITNDVYKYLSFSLRTTKARANRNWAFQRGGPLYHGSEAGGYARTGGNK